MPTLTRRPRPADRRTRALALAADLADDLEAADLDVVDGEFFWLCCRADLLEAAEALAKGRPRPIGARAPSDENAAADDDFLNERVEPLGTFDYLREGLRFAEDFIALADETAELYPGAVWRRLLDGERVTMRGGQAEVRYPEGRSGRGGMAQLHLKVFSGAWIGAQVEDELRRLASAQARRFVAEPESPADDIALRVAFAFIDGERISVKQAQDGAPGAPYIEVIAHFPLPPVGAIAREYDALIRGERRWHLGLPGGGSRQEKEVAIRTWAVGLLVAAGDRFGDAMATACRAVGLAEVSQARFNQDRQKLTERVPEAAPYLFAPRTQAEAEARAEGRRTLANHSDALPPLQPPAPEERAYT